MQKQTCPFSFPVPARSLSSMTIKKETIKHEKWMHLCVALVKAQPREFAAIPQQVESRGGKHPLFAPAHGSGGRDGWDKTLTPKDEAA